MRALHVSVAFTCGLVLFNCGDNVSVNAPAGGAGAPASAGTGGANAGTGGASAGTGGTATAGKGGTGPSAGNAGAPSAGASGASGAGATGGSAGSGSAGAAGSAAGGGKGGAAAGGTGGASAAGSGGIAGAAGGAGVSGGAGSGGTGVAGQGGSGTSGSGGGGCQDPAQCPQPASAACGAATCNSGACGLSNQPDDTFVSNASAIDCQQTVCKAGAEVSVAADTEVPDDSDPCTIDTCSGGVPGHAPKCMGANSCCGGTCVNLKSDPTNCGKCGHDCGAATCDQGACTVLAETPPSCAGGLLCAGGKTCCESRLVPGGAFQMGRSVGGTDAFAAGAANELPEHGVLVSPYYLDTFEVTVGRFRKFVEQYNGTPPAPSAGAHPKINGSGWQPTWDSLVSTTQAGLITSLKSCNATYVTWTDSAAGNENRPITCIDWYTAFAFCAWDGGRLPTEAEWEFAAVGGSENRIYPWGVDQPTSSLANFACWGDGSAPGVCALTHISPFKLPVGHPDAAARGAQRRIDASARNHGPDQERQSLRGRAVPPAGRRKTPALACDGTKA